MEADVLEVTDEDRLAVLADYRRWRQNTGRPPAVTMIALRNHYSDVIASQLFSMLPPDLTTARRWRVADEYVRKIGGRSRYWFLPPFARR